ncbi:MAG: class I SAM-dependent methyltransferase [Planctomycetota bacterium]
MASGTRSTGWWYHFKQTLRCTPLIGRPLAWLHRKLFPKPAHPWDDRLPPGASVAEIQTYMDRRFAAGTAYTSTNQIRWLHALWEENSQAVYHLILRAGNPLDLRILDIGCGRGGVVGEIDRCRELVGIELSAVAVEDARKNYAHRKDARFEVMDATKPDFPDGYFDVAVARELLEHVPEPAKVIAGAFRVLRPGGLFVVTSPNRDSFHLRMNRILGYNDFVCSMDHVKEFSYPEMCGMLTAAGFTLDHAQGIFFQPYWGIPHVDDTVRRYTDDDPEVVEWLRLLGRRAGPEFGFSYAIAARKSGGSAGAGTPAAANAATTASPATDATATAARPTV